MTNEERKVIELALEALEDWANWSDHTPPKTSQAITAIKEALAQPEQEPVAWYCKEGLKRGVSLKQESLEWEPLYTTPPQRTWVGLTDEEIEQGCKESWVTEQAFQSAVWWAEAKLKEKNT